MIDLQNNVIWITKFYILGDLKPNEAMSKMYKPKNLKPFAY